MENLPLQFEKHLRAEKKVSGKTLRNYRSDLLHFFTWSLRYAQGKTLRHTQGKPLETVESLLPYLTNSLVGAYKSYHLENKTPISTANRRLSTLRNFTRFLVQIGVLGNDPTYSVSNLGSRASLSFEEKVQKMVEDFQKYLESERVSPVTSKNYLSDVRQFLMWMGRQRVAAQS